MSSPTKTTVLPVSSSTSSLDTSTGGDPYYGLANAFVKELMSKEPERRSAAAREVAKLAHDYAVKETPVGVECLSQLLKGLNALALHRTSHAARMGGLLALAHVAVEVKKLNRHYEDKYAELLLRPILTSLADPNTTVRRAALDALYNCIKVMQFGIRAHFTELITALSNHAMELDQDILMAVEMCDRVLKDLVTTDVSIEPEKFVVAIRERLTVDNAFARQFHLGWIVCALDMKYTLLARFLPDLLDGVLVCLCDRNTEIQMQAKKSLRGLMRCLREDMEGQKEPDYTSMIIPLLSHISGKVDRVKAPAFEYLAEFVRRSQQAILPFVADILEDTLPIHSITKSQMDEHDYRQIKKNLYDIELELLRIVRQHLDGADSRSGENSNGVAAAGFTPMLDLDQVVRMLLKRAGKANSKDGTRAAAVRWLCQLQLLCPQKLASRADEIFVVLCKLLPSASDTTVLLVIQFVADVCNFDNSLEGGGCGDGKRTERFKGFVQKLFALFGSNKEDMEAKGKTIIRHFCELTSSEQVFITLSELVADKAETDISLARDLADCLNVILFTAPETFDMRTKLKHLKTESSIDLFKCLYRSWSCSPFATVMLSLLSECYEHAAFVIRYLSQQIVTLDLLESMEKVVFLVDDVTFADVRLRLFDSPQRDELVYVLYVLYSMLPMGEARDRLKDRLQCLPKFDKDMSRYARCETEIAEASKSLRDTIDFTALLQEFKSKFERHRRATEAARMERLRRDGLRIVDITRLREFPTPDSVDNE